MKNSKHTESPWSLLSNRRLNQITIYGGNPTKAILSIKYEDKKDAFTTSEAEADANAKLIAAAPDMLKALLIMQERIKAVAMAGNNMTPADYYKLLYGDNEVNNAIEKATK